MSSYGGYCQRQAAECARRVKLARSPEVVTHYRSLGLRWLKLAQKERARRGLKSWFAARPGDVVRGAEPSGGNTVGFQPGDEATWGDTPRANNASGAAGKSTRQRCEL